jgi:hypothetical protein
MIFQDHTIGAHETQWHDILARPQAGVNFAFSSQLRLCQLRLLCHGRRARMTTWFEPNAGNPTE